MLWKPQYQLYVVEGVVNRWEKQSYTQPRWYTDLLGTNKVCTFDAQTVEDCMFTCEYGTGPASKEYNLQSRSKVSMHTHTHTGAWFSEQSLLFIPCELPPLPEGLVIQEGLVRICAGMTAHVPVTIVNTTANPAITGPLLKDEKQIERDWTTPTHHSVLWGVTTSHSERPSH